MMSLSTLHPAKSVPLNSQCICTTSTSVADSKSQVKTALDPTVTVRLQGDPKALGLGTTSRKIDK